ncbi:BQ2448_600 [Microbotryum intermedium]|uniref:BQ2448_600 protein n=1 Tax=Microbotryum intermedium TaxID=269621 RepID=A0A238F6V9_9BASI|nr:BQ2448_600 [Microbotryum intermedium]
MGEGQDCTRIPDAGFVGCTTGRCTVFSCMPRFRPSLVGTGWAVVEGLRGSSNARAR